MLIDIPAIRKTLKMELVDFASLVGFAPDQISSFENGTSTPQPSDIKKIVEAVKGHYAQQPEYDQTLEEAIRGTLKGIEEVLRENAPLLRHRWLPQFDIYIHQLYHDARRALLLGMNQAAIFCLVILIEHVLKDLIHDERTKRNGGKLSPRDEEIIENYDLKKAVAQTRQLGIVNNSEEEELRRLEEWTRNPSIHSNLLKLTEHITVSAVPYVVMESGEVRQRDLSGRSDRAFRKQAKIQLDAKIVWPLFLWAENFIHNKYKDTIEKALRGELPGFFLIEN